MKKLLVAVVVACGFAAFANEWYVDPTNGVDTAAGTQDAPRKTLKGAMEIPDLAANDTIWLLPGEYAEETMDDLGTRRLYVEKAGLRFRSTAGRDRTFIVGRHDGSSGYNGDNAIACVKIAKGAEGCVFEGITFRDGAARYLGKDDPGNDSSGGGIYDMNKCCWVINCRFVDCVAYATGGGMVGGNVSGTEFVGCKTSGGSSACAQRLDYAEFCLFYDGTKSGLLDYGGTFVNCTFYGSNISGSKLFYRNPFKLYNCLAYGFKLSCGSQGKAGADLTGYVTITNTYFNIYDGNGSVTVGANSLTNADETTVRFVSPAMGDFRLTDYSDAAELGDAAYLSLLPDTFPKGFDRKDVYGNPVTATSGAIPAGCALEVPHQTGGRVDFEKAFEVQELGFSFAADDYFNPIREDYTYMFRPVVAEGVHVNNVRGVFGKELNSGKTAWVDIGEYFFPLRRKGGWVPVGVRPELVSTNTFTFTSSSAAYVYYADPNCGNDDYDGKSSNVVYTAEGKVEHGPFKTLMGAMAKIDNTSGNGGNKILYLMPGTYAEGQSDNPTGSGTDKAPYGVKYRVYVGAANLVIIGLEGPEKTFIVGAPDPDKEDGLGPNAIGGVWLKSGASKCVQGVTITGCYSTDTESTAYTVGGCAFYGGGSDTTYCYDCIISNNTAVFAPVKSYGTMARCKILNNKSKRYLCSRYTVSSCVFAGNTMTVDRYLNDSNGTLYGCTFDISPEDASHSLATTYYSLVLNKQVGSKLTQGCCDTIPLVADPATFDYRLGTLSPAVLFGDVSARTAGTAYYLASDVDGNKLEIKDGKMTVGAVHSGPRAPCVAIADGGVAGATVTGGEFGTNVVRSAGDVTLTASVKRPLEGFSVNGEVVPATGLSYTFTPSADPDAATFVSPVYGTNWYVNASATSDDAPGGSWETARQTIRSATTNAVAGDVIHVAPGVYGEAEGTQRVNPQCVVPMRVVVPADVTLESSEGAEKTFIVGKGPDTPDDDYGLTGTGSVRCVYAAAGSVLRGFTITGGHTCKIKTGVDADLSYSAIQGVSRTSGTVIEDCIISNNFGNTYTIVYVTLRNSKILNNATYSYGSAGYYCNYEGCLFDGNRGERQIYQADAPIVNCTIGTKNRANMDGTGTNPTVLGYSVKGAGMKLVNTLWAAGKQWVSGSGGALATVATNCIIQKGVIDVAGGVLSANCVNCYTNYTTANITASVINQEDCRLRENSPAIDAGTNDLVNLARDLDGNPRISNGTVDIGAFEYDWRGRYKEDLGARVTAVTAASPEVVETADGTVRIPSGALEGTFKPGALRLEFTLKGGTLDVYLGGEIVETFEATDAVELSKEIWPSDENNAFRLAFTPNAADGYAEIARLKKGASGIIFIVR